MTNLARLEVQLGGWTGAPGVSVLHFSEGTSGGWGVQEVIDDFFDEVNTLLGTAAPVWVAGVTVTANPELRIFDAANGDLVDIVSPSDAPPIHTSTAAASPTSRATMGLVQFGTNEFLNGRRLKGRMFLGPIAAASIGNDGLITSALREAVPTWFEAITSGLGPRLAVWHRPTLLAPESGTWGDVTTVTVRQTPSYLSSRLY
jgi:hypothetical protein